jgi:small-conductance mechanosensitive channel
MPDQIQDALPLLAPFQFALYGLLAGGLLEFFVLRRVERVLREGGQLLAASIVRALHWAPVCACTAIGLHETFRASTLREWVQFDLDKVLEASVILVFTLLAGRVVAVLLRNYLQTNSAALPSASLLTSLARVGIWSIGALLILQSFEVSITPLLTALGVGGLAVALALRDTLENLFSGLQIIASRQLRLGDYIRLESGSEGVVSDITWRNTTIKDLSNNMVVVPNVKLAQSTFTNFALPDREMQVPVPVLVPYGSDLDAVERIALEVARDVLSAAAVELDGYEPYVRFQEFGNDNVRLTVNLRTAEYADQFALRSDLLKSLHARFLSEDIGAPFPAHVGIAPLNALPASSPASSPVAPSSGAAESANVSKI